MIVFLMHVIQDLNVEAATIGLLFAFACLAAWGISESAVVALIMFIAHIVTLIALIIVCIIYAIQDEGKIFRENWSDPLPDIIADGSKIAEGSVPAAIFFGLASALLGISGFETSANFIEEQKPGVFVKTLRNMWVAVTLFNPTIALVAMAVMPMSTIREHPNDLLVRRSHC